MTESHITGSIHAKHGKYYAVIAYYDETGTRKQKWINSGLPAKNNRRKANEFLRKAMEEFTAPRIEETVDPQPEITTDSTILYCDFLTQWMEMCRPSWAPKTYSAYSNIINHQLIPYFKERGLRLCDVKAQHIQAYYQKRLNEDSVKANTVLRHHAILHKSLKDAMRMELIPGNPADKVILPKKEKFIGSFYSAEEIKTLLAAAKGSPLEPAVVLTAYYGLRRSEVAGLQWSAIDFENKTISIENKLVQIPGDGKTQIIASQTLKNDASLRTLPLIDEVEHYLRGLQKRQTENERLFGNTYDREYDGYLCRFPDGKLVSPNYVSTRFPRLLEKAGLRKIRFHDLRHSCASLLLSLGFSIKDIQVWLGHNNFSTTADIYSHLDFKSKLALAAKLGEAIHPEEESTAS